MQLHQQLPLDSAPPVSVCGMRAVSGVLCVGCVLLLAYHECSSAEGLVKAYACEGA